MNSFNGVNVPRNQRFYVDYEDPYVNLFYNGGDNTIMNFLSNSNTENNSNSNNNSSQNNGNNSNNNNSNFSFGQNQNTNNNSNNIFNTNSNNGGNNGGNNSNNIFSNNNQNNQGNIFNNPQNNQNNNQNQNQNQNNNIFNNSQNNQNQNNQNNIFGNSQNNQNQNNNIFSNSQSNNQNGYFFQPGSVCGVGNLLRTNRLDNIDRSRLFAPLDQTAVNQYMNAMDAYSNDPYSNVYNSIAENRPVIVPRGQGVDPDMVYSPYVNGYVSRNHPLNGISNWDRLMGNTGFLNQNNNANNNSPFSNYVNPNYRRWQWKYLYHDTLVDSPNFFNMTYEQQLEYDLVLVYTPSPNSNQCWVIIPHYVG